MQINADKEVPPGVSGWNWGAFIFTWIWGIFNNTFIALLCLFPPAHLIMMFVLGAKGNEWAWRNRDWPSIEEFHRTQRKWAIWGIGGLFGIITFFVSIVAWKISTEGPQIHAMMNNFDPHRRFCNYALASAESNERCYRSLGTPLQVRGNIEATSNRHGYSEVSIPVRGSRSDGTIYLRTRLDANSVHRLDRAELELSNNERVQLDTAQAERAQARERAEVQIVAARHASNNFVNREPDGREEAEELYRESLQQIEQNATIKQVLGTRISAQVEAANIDSEGPMGTADFHVVLSGNETRALVDLKGTRSMGRWIFDGANAALETANGLKTIVFPPKVGS